MHPIVKNIIGFMAGLIIGAILNGLTIKFLSPLIGVPEGVNPNDVESIKANMHLYEMRHFVAPFVAHAIGSLSGGYVCSMIAAKYQLGLSLGIALLFLFGGVAMVVMLPSPMWFNITDLVLAYFPMAYLGWVLAGRKRWVAPAEVHKDSV